MNDIKDNRNISGSFRDSSGFIFLLNGTIYRQINFVYKEKYDFLIKSGLYEHLVNSGLLIPHKEVNVIGPMPYKSYKVIKPEKVPFISYPYEWCFSQLKDAALTTLEIQKKSLNFGMSLKDCSAYNVQFKNGKPVFIDTLSFEEYRENQPWIAYRQFCQHFLAPLALMSHKDIRLNQLLKVYIDGVPLDLASSLLSMRTRFDFSLLTHIHLHAKVQGHFSDRNVKIKKSRFTRLSFMGLIDNLESAVRKLKLRPQDSEWGNYYKDTNYSQEGLKHKRQVVADFLGTINPKVVWDLGANEGLFSRIAESMGIEVISFDIDPVAVENNYTQSVSKGETNILPLLLDLTNPSPGIGWDNEERMSLSERGPADTMLALALIHHLSISNNLPFSKIASFFSITCNSLIIEFVPKDDSQVQRLLINRRDIFLDYTQQSFEKEFEKYFKVQNSIKLKDSKRILFLMIKKEN